MARTDGGGNRTLKIEGSTVEFLMPEDKEGNLVLIGSRTFGPRFDPGTDDFEDSYLQDMWFRYGDGNHDEVEILGDQASEWKIERGLEGRKYKNEPLEPRPRNLSGTMCETC